MSELPWGDGSFDVVTGVNAFVYADDGGLLEAHRVLGPGGTLALGFWRDPGDFGGCMQELGQALEPYMSDEGVHTPLRMADAEATAALLSTAGFEVTKTGDVDAESEFPDIEIAYRGRASTGMLYPVTQAGAEEALKERCLPILAELDDEQLGVRMRAVFGWVVARRN